MSDIFREVDDALQQEKVTKLWREYGPTLILSAVLLVLMTAAVTGYRAWDAKKDAEETARLTKALESDNAVEQLVEFAKDARSGQAASALMTAAGLYTDKHEYTKAAETYKQAFEQSGTPGAFRDLARILYVRALLMTKEKQEGEKLLEVLQPVLKNGRGPYVWQARLDAALISDHMLKDPARSLGYLKDFEKADNIPLSLKEKAKDLSELYETNTESKEEKGS